jgi:hypothetical protein
MQSRTLLSCCIWVKRLGRYRKYLYSHNKRLKLEQNHTFRSFDINVDVSWNSKSTNGTDEEMSIYLEVKRNILVKLYVMTIIMAMCAYSYLLRDWFGPSKSDGGFSFRVCGPCSTRNHYQSSGLQKDSKYSSPAVGGPNALFIHTVKVIFSWCSYHIR